MREVLDALEGEKGRLMKLKRHLFPLAMVVAVGVFFAGLTIARADSGDTQGDDPPHERTSVHTAHEF